MTMVSEKQYKSRVMIDGLNFPEGPVFDFNGNLWFVEIKGGNLCQWDGEKLFRYDVDGTPNGAAIDKEGIIWFCDSGRGEIRTFNPKNKQFKTICNKTTDGEKLKRPNDLTFDKGGNLIFSDHADGRTEYVSTFCVLPYNGYEAKVISSGKLFTNGLAFCNNGSTLILAETYNQQLWIGKWDDQNLELINERPFAKVGSGLWGPDGLAFDENEQLYVAVFNEHQINVLNKKGELIDEIFTEGSRPTSCAFDPIGNLGLVVTEAEKGEIISFPWLGKGLSLYH